MIVIDFIWGVVKDAGKRYSVKFGIAVLRKTADKLEEMFLTKKEVEE